MQTLAGLESETLGIFIWARTESQNTRRMMYLMFHHMTVLTRNGLDHGSFITSIGCLQDRA
jgi:hypothetical protein